MEKIVIDKELLKGYKSLLVALENCDAYEIDVNDIVDVYCEAELLNKKGNTYHTSDGFIKISARASKTIEKSVLQNHKKDKELGQCLRERLEICAGGADMVSFSLKDNQNREIDIYVPYNPLEDIMHGGEIELSNCPSYEMDNDGNISIAFGESSKQPKRKDNNYSELIAGWREAFDDYNPKVLKVKAERLSTFGEEQNNLSFYFKISDKKCKKGFVELVFMDCKSLSMEMFFPNRGNCEIVMSKMADGHIYVGFDALGVDFICASVLEYDYYCNQETE